MSKIKTIIADDEPKARRRIQRMLQDHNEFDVTKTCSDGEETLKAINELNPDLIFLDIQMPGYDGFELLEKLDSERLPKIVFITAYDEFALRAFEVHAIDYLMKPFDRGRFEKALEEVKKVMKTSSRAEIGQSVKQLLETIRQHQSGTDKIMIKENKKFYLLDPPDIDWIEAAGNYIKIIVADEQYMVRETMKNMEKKLDPGIFFRIHRSTIVNIKKIKHIEPWFRGGYRVVMIDGTQFTMSRKYTRLLEAF